MGRGAVGEDVAGVRGCSDPKLNFGYFDYYADCASTKRLV
jgi:hypothetical protein